MATFSNILFSSASQVIFTDTLVPHLQVFSWRQSLDTHNSFQVMSLATDLHIDRHHGATSRRVRQLLQESRRKFQVRRNFFKNKIKISLDSAAPYRHPSSSSGLLKSEDCFTLPRAEQVGRPLSRCHAYSTVRARSSVSLFRARSSYSYQHHFHAVRGKRFTTAFTISHAK